MCPGASAVVDGGGGVEHELRGVLDRCGVQGCAEQSGGGVWSQDWGGCGGGESYAGVDATSILELYVRCDADDGEGIYLQDAHRDWYYASLFGPCLDLPFATRIGVVNWGFETVDDSSTILVGRDRCRIDRLVHSGPPPKRVKKAKKG